MLLFYNMILIYVLVYTVSVIGAYRFFVHIWKEQLVSTKTFVVEILLCLIPILNTFITIINWYINIIIEKTKRRL